MRCTFSHIPILHTGPILAPPMNRTCYFFNSSAWTSLRSAYELYLLPHSTLHNGTILAPPMNRTR